MNILNDYPKIQYFLNYIELQTKNPGVFFDDFYPLNCHVILIMIDEELRYNQNQRNLGMLLDKLRRISNADEIINERKNYLNLLFQYLKSDCEFSKYVVCNLLDVYNNNFYNDKMCKKIYELLLNDAPLESVKKEIRFWASNIVVEMNLIGYSNKAIRKIFYNLFSFYDEICDDFWYTDFPFVPKNLSVEEAKTYIKNLTIENRVEYIYKIFTQQSKNYIFLCNISGIDMQKQEVCINNVDIYDKSCLKKFNFQKDIQSIEEQIITSNAFAAVHISSFDVGNTKENIEKIIAIAANDLEKAFDIIYSYRFADDPIKYDISSYIILDEKQQFVCATGPLLRKAEKNRKMPDKIDEFQNLLETHSKIYLDDDNDISNIIINSGRWYRKGSNSNNQEDILVNYWICVENLIPNDMEIPKGVMNNKNAGNTKYDKLSAIMPYIILKNCLLDRIWKHFYYIFENRFCYQNYGISKELAEKSGFKNGRVYISDFINNIDELINSINLELDKDLLTDLQKHLNSNNISDEIKQYTETIQEKLLLCYRFRNLIVHNAKFSMFFLEYYSNFLRLHSGELYRIIVQLHTNAPKENVKELLIKQFLKVQSLYSDVPKNMIFREWINDKLSV